MKYPSSSKHINFLFQFFLLFKINRFELINVTDSMIKGIIGWPDQGVLYYDADEEIQHFEWDIHEEYAFHDAIDIMCYLADNQLVSLDKIMISESQLEQNFSSWGKERFASAFDFLLRVRVDMVDDNERTDQFFLHL